MASVEQCPICGMFHQSDTRYSPTRTGYLVLATWRSEENAKKRGRDA